MRPAAIAATVVLLHAGGLYALQSGLLHRAVELVVPVEILSELVELPQPVVQPALPPQPKPAAAPQAKAVPKLPAPLPAPQPLAMKDVALSPAAATTPVGTTSPAPPVEEVTQQALAAAPSPAPATAPAAPPAPAKVELPSNNADYLNNPSPAYPPVSKRLGETGKVIVRVYISTDGNAQKGEVRSSSGFERLDAAALAAVLKWRYVPGKRGGVAEAMWVSVPITFHLD
jgi:periplasmic protein TonB